jgi:hypothetical protein
VGNEQAPWKVRGMTVVFGKGRIQPERLTLKNRRRVVAYINRKQWWHVPPRDPDAYDERGMFLASSFKEAEFWGRPNDNPLKVSVVHPLIGDEETIEKALFGRQVSSEEITVEERWKSDARMRKAALARGYDAIVLMSPSSFVRLKSTGKVPRSLELNVLDRSKVLSES